MSKKYDKTTNEDLFRVVTIERLGRIERLLKWLVIQRINDDVWTMKNHPLKDARGKPIPIKEEQWQKSPDISDIIED